MDVTFAATAFAPVVLGFFGLGTGLMIFTDPGWTFAVAVPCLCAGAAAVFVLTATNTERDA